MNDIPLCLRVNYDLSTEFVSKVKSEGCKIEKVIEIINCKLLEYWIDCPKEKENIISDYAFMTFIKNPVFQMHYSGTKAFESLAEKYIQEREEKDHNKENIIQKENDGLRSCLIMALYHDGWADENGEARPIHNKLGAPKWVKEGFKILTV